MASCIATEICKSSILNNIQDSCDNPMFSGIESVGVIINFDDVEAYTRDATNGRIIRNIKLKEGAVAYKFVQSRKDPFTGTTTTMNEGDYRNDFTHSVAGYVPMDGAEAAAEVLTPMANGKFVVIVQNQWKHRDSQGVVDNEWQIFGIDKGLRPTSMEKAFYDNNGYWVVELQEQNITNSGTFFIPSEGEACDAINELFVNKGEDGEA